MTILRPNTPNASAPTWPIWPLWPANVNVPCPGRRVRGSVPRARGLRAFDCRREAPCADRTRSIRQGARSRLQVLGRLVAESRRLHRRPDRDDLPVLADGEGNRPSALDPLAHGDSSRNRHPSDRARLHRRRRERRQAAGAAESAARGHRGHHEVGGRGAADGAESAGDVRGRDAHAQGRRADRLLLGQVPADRRREMAGAPADDEVGGAGDGYDHHALRRGGRSGRRTRSRSSSSRAPRSAAGPRGPRPRSIRASWRSRPW